MAKGYNEIIMNLSKWDNLVKAGIYAVSLVIASKVKSYAKLNKRWKNQTSHAVQGLDTTVEWTSNTKIYIYAYHSVIYGIWLELANSGKYAILEESLSYYKGEFFNAVKKIMGVI